MRILFWVPYPSEGASNRMRVEQYLPYLEREGIDFTVRPFWSSPAFRILYKKGYYIRKFLFFTAGTIRRVVDIIAIARYDMVFIHREAYPVGGVFFEGILAFLKKPVIFDFDDAIFLPATSRTNFFIEKFRNPGKIIQIISISRSIIAGNRYLAEFASKINSRVSVIPTCIDTDRYSPALSKRSSGDIITIGWIGSVTTVEFLSLMDNVFRQLSSRFGSQRVRFKIVGGPYAAGGLTNVENIAWSGERELEDLRSFDIGIMPMPDNEWTRGKCGFKAILYMSVGIPCVSSPVGANNEIITEGSDGYFARDEKEWVDKLSVLIEDPGLRKKLGSQARKAIEARYSLKACAPDFVRVIKEVNLKG